MNENTDKMTDAELKVLLKSLGGKTAGNLKRENMLKRIAALQKTANRPAEPTAIDEVLGLSGVIPEVKARPPGNTHEEVLAAVKHCAAKGMEVKFDEWGWNFSFKGRSDSGNLAMPLDVIVKCANAVCIVMPKATAMGDPARYA